MSPPLRRWQLLIWFCGMVLILYELEPAQANYFIFPTILWSFVAPHFIGQVLTKLSMRKPATSPPAQASNLVVIMAFVVVVFFIIQAVVNFIAWISAN